MLGNVYWIDREQSILQIHKDIVFDYPPGVQPLGSTRKCKCQGMLVPERVVTVQGHPEFTEEIMAQLLDSCYKRSAFSDDEYREAMVRVGKRHEGLLVGRRFIEFLLDK